MSAILLWILTSILDAISLWSRKKSINESTLSKTLFKWLAFPFAFIFILWIVYFIWVESMILTDYIYLFALFWVIIIWIVNTYLQLHILKQVKLSDVMPYSDLDKIFIIVFWFFLYYWTDKWVSIYTLLISLATIIIVLLFTIDIKKIKIPKIIWLYILHKAIRATKILLLSYILLKYSSITIISVNWFIELILYSIIALLLKDPIINLFRQSKVFYINRWLATILWRVATVIGLYIIQSAWVIIATLIWFFWVVFNIFSMKFILNDNPTKKQILLAFLVIGLIGLWYYFK